MLISYETFAHVRDEIHCEEHGHIRVKGIAYPVAISTNLDGIWGMSDKTTETGRSAVRAMPRVVAFFFLIAFAAQARADAERGWQAYLAGDYAAAVGELRPLAEAGEAQAQFYMGTLAEHGAGVPKDYGAALEWYARAAGQGHVGAQFAIGLLYHDGAGQGAVPQDPVAAARWLGAAAEAGNAMAQHLLGRMYRLGRGVARDDALALKWSQTAAQRGVPGAQFEMGVLISSRPHGRAERVAAYAWFLLAERAGHPGARQNLDLLNRKMHQVDIDQARDLADAWASPQLADHGRRR